MNSIFGNHSDDIAKIIDDFLPEKLFDAHMHISHTGYESVESGNDIIDLNIYKKNMESIVPNREIRCNAITYPCDVLKKPEELKKSSEFLAEQLDLHKGCVGEIIVLPNDTEESIKERILSKDIRGLKCYWIYSQSSSGDQSDICDYLPESAWELANREHMFITLHMVKDKALADGENLKYIKTMAKRYPDAKLILAHCGRAFASWTAFDTVDELVGFENIYFDFSGICESPAITYILKKVGVKRCMWGTDYPISTFIGKAISIADTFYWITLKDLNNFNTKSTLRSWRVGVENIMAVRQAGKILDLAKSDIDDLFYNNAVDILC